MYSALLSAVVLSCGVLALTVEAKGKECRDNPLLENECRMMRQSFGDRICLTKYSSINKLMREQCQATCGLCPKSPGKALSPTIPCYKSRYGCCWDMITAAKDTAGNGCPLCADRHRVVCSMFRWMCPVKKTNADYVKMNCPVACGRCVPRTMHNIGPSVFDFYARSIKKLYRHKRKNRRNRRKKLRHH